MIQLQTYIPEIKIIPNIKEPQVGDQIKFDDTDKLHGGGLYNIIRIDRSTITLKHHKIDSNMSINFTTYKALLDDGEIKLIKKQNIKEIKIQPNNVRYPKIGDVYYLDPKEYVNASKGEYEITDLGDNDWLWVRLGFVGNKFWVDREQFEQWIKLGIIKYLHS